MPTTSLFLKAGTRQMGIQMGENQLLVWGPAPRPPYAPPFNSKTRPRAQSRAEGGTAGQDAQTIPEGVAWNLISIHPLIQLWGSLSLAFESGNGWVPDTPKDSTTPPNPVPGAGGQMQGRSGGPPHCHPPCCAPLPALRGLGGQGFPDLQREGGRQMLRRWGPLAACPPHTHC